ncbi:hypothetical protein DFJ73DRAFT_854966 [Zopfochytrium polystomum]|nr:hypothetical protein DFJ73DRAFT_854966 [Zopfochytrium polystomum]
MFAILNSRCVKPPPPPAPSLGSSLQAAPRNDLGTKRKHKEYEDSLALAEKAPPPLFKIRRPPKKARSERPPTLEQTNHQSSHHAPAPTVESIAAIFDEALKGFTPTTAAKLEEMDLEEVCHLLPDDHPIFALDDDAALSLLEGIPDSLTPSALAIVLFFALRPKVHNGGRPPSRKVVAKLSSLAKTCPDSVVDGVLVPLLAFAKGGPEPPLPAPPPPSHGNDKAAVNDAATVARALKELAVPAVARFFKKLSWDRPFSSVRVDASAMKFCARGEWGDAFVPVLQAAVQVKGADAAMFEDVIASIRKFDEHTRRKSNKFASLLSAVLNAIKSHGLKLSSRAVLALREAVGSVDSFMRGALEKSLPTT